MYMLQGNAHNKNSLDISFDQFKLESAFRCSFEFKEISFEISNNILK